MHPDIRRIAWVSKWKSEWVAEQLQARHLKASCSVILGLFDKILRRWVCTWCLANHNIGLFELCLSKLIFQEGRDHIVLSSWNNSRISYQYVVVNKWPLLGVQLIQLGLIECEEPYDPGLFIKLVWNAVRVVIIWAWWSWRNWRQWLFTTSWCKNDYKNKS